MRSIYPRSLTVVMSICVAIFASDAIAIKKCQDSDGKWYYGDFAVQACSRSKVTTLNERGFVEAEREAPLTDEERAAAAEQSAAEQARLAEEQAQQEERNRVLSIYETEADIQRQRENQIYSIQSNIDVTQAYISSLEDRVKRNLASQASATHPTLKEKLVAENDDLQAKIASAREQLVDLDEQKQAVEARFDRELELYRELKASE